jgi:hypothetical protein
MAKPTDKSVTAWAVCDPEGRPISHYIHRTRTAAVTKFSLAFASPDETLEHAWRRARREGYTVQRVTVALAGPLEPRG